MIDSIKNYFSESDENEKVEIVEDTSGTWTYHLKRPDERKAICGRRVMNSSVTKWGAKPPSQIPITYCSECEQIAVDENLSFK